MLKVHQMVIARREVFSMRQLPYTLKLEVDDPVCPVTTLATSCGVPARAMPLAAEHQQRIRSSLATPQTRIDLTCRAGTRRVCQLSIHALIDLLDSLQLIRQRLILPRRRQV